MSGSHLNFGRGLDFTGAVEAGGNPRVHVDGGATIESLLIHTNLAPADFELIVEVDGEERVKLNGQQMLDREHYDGYATAANEYVFTFSDPMAKLQSNELATGLVTQVGQRMVVSLEIADNVTPNEPFADLYLETSPNKAEVVRLYVLPEVVPITQVGENQYDGFRKGKAQGELAIRRAFLYGSIANFKLEQNDRAVFGKRMLSAQINNNRLARYGKTAPNNCVVYDPIVRGNVLSDVLDLFTQSAPTRATLTTTNSSDVKAIVEYVKDLSFTNAR